MYTIGYERKRSKCSNVRKTPTGCITNKYAIDDIVYESHLRNRKCNDKNNINNNNKNNNNNNNIEQCFHS